MTLIQATTRKTESKGQLSELRKKGNVPELDTCKNLNVTMLWGIGGGKIQSSSWLINGGKDEN